MTVAYPRSIVPFLALCCAGLIGTGCSLINPSSLATNSGPSKTGGEWSVAAEQWVHVGEKVDFNYVLMSGYADYAILSIPQAGITRVCLQADRNRFYFEGLTFNVPTLPGKPLVAKVTCYRERGIRDYMEADGKLLVRESPDDPSDAKVSSSHLKIHVYQASLTIDMPACHDGYRWQTASLTLHCGGDLPAIVHENRPYRKGFKVEGPSASGSFVVTYEPTADQLNRTGTTRAVLSVFDTKNKEHTQVVLVPTP